MGRQRSGALSRRNVLKLVSGATGAAMVAGGPVQTASAYDPGPEETASRYRETEHVKAFYRTNRYEGLKKDRSNADQAR